MATYHIIFVTTKVQNRKKNEEYGTFDKCENARQLMYVDRMAGKIKDFILGNCIEKDSHGIDYNGYGWGSWIHRYLLTPAKAKELQALIEGKKAEKAKNVKTKEDIIKAWAKRLDKFTGCGLDVAIGIANEKLEYQKEQTEELWERQQERYSERRQKLIKSIWRANPLRRIEDSDHAQRILAASHRHNSTCYEIALEHYREEAKWGNIDYEDVRSLAREAAANGSINF